MPRFNRQTLGICAGLCLVSVIMSYATASSFGDGLAIPLPGLTMIVTSSFEDGISVRLTDAGQLKRPDQCLPPVDDRMHT